MSTTKEVVLKVQGMDCTSCAKSIETGVKQLEQVESCQINFTTTKLRVTGPVGQQRIIDRVRELGYEVVDEADTDSPSAESSNFLHFMWQRLDTRLALIGAVLLIPGLVLEEILAMHHPVINLASLGALLLAGFPTAQNAWRTIKINREINMNVLMTIAALGAVVIGAYTEAAMIMVLFALGEALEGYTAGQARQSLKSLMQVVPRWAIRITQQNDQSQEEKVEVDQLLPGDVIMVKPGERIPMDGVVQHGLSSVNQAPITGESKLIEKTAGAEIFAGSINGEGVLEVEVTHTAQDNTISRLIKLVEEAQESKAPSQRFIDKFAKYYTPVVVVLAVLVATIPPLLFGQPFWNPDAETFGWFYRGLALLVVACPCALVISTPVSLVSAISNAAQHGVVVKGGAYIEALSRVKAIAFDKTGTITTGQPSVVALRATACKEETNLLGTCNDCNEVLALAHAVERRSEHPLAHAITSKATQRGLDSRYPPAETVQAMTGKGVVGQVNGDKVLIGSHTYFDTAISHPKNDCSAAQHDALRGHTPLMVGANNNYVGTITVADTVRDSSQQAIAALKEIGLNHMVMLTGDDQKVAESIAKAVGVTEVKAELLPQDKVSAIQTLQQQHGFVAMVGDGINDAPALATADVGLALGGAGATTQAMETADITLMQAGLSQLPFIVRLSRATMHTVQFNVIFSIGIKLIFLVLVLLGQSTMWLAVLADVGTSILVTLNGMRLLWKT